MNVWIEGISVDVKKVEQCYKWMLQVLIREKEEKLDKSKHTSHGYEYVFLLYFTTNTVEFLIYILIILCTV